MPYIGYEGGHYTIKEIISNDNDSISFYVEDSVAIRNELNKFEMRNVSGKVVMNFVDGDHVWLEIDYTDEKYPTDKSFPKSDFHGKDTIYWRGTRIPE
jgi:hypothetical protein